jgi:ribosomal protein S27AE
MEMVRDKPLRDKPASVDCAQCGQGLFIPEWSENLATGGIRHLWVCEACGYSFETTVRFAAA